METDKSDFGDSVYALTNFRLILIRMFLNLVHLDLCLKIAQTFSLIQRGHVGMQHSHLTSFKDHVVTLHGNLVISLFLPFCTHSTKHKLPTLIKPRHYSNMTDFFPCGIS